MPLSLKFTKIPKLKPLVDTRAETGVEFRRARMVESVDTRDLKSLSFGSVGSSPSPGTIINIGMEKLLKEQVSQFMTKKVIAVKPEESIKKVFKLMDEHAILGLPVVDDDNAVIGIVTESDLISHFTTLKTPQGISILGSIVYLGNLGDFNKNLKDHCAELVKDVMTTDVVTIMYDATLHEAINLMAEKKMGRLPVIGKKRELVGILTRTDVVHEIAKLKNI